jgi:hypothetical protein
VTLCNICRRRRANPDLRSVPGLPNEPICSKCFLEGLCDIRLTPKGKRAVELARKGHSQRSIERRLRAEGWL